MADESPNAKRPAEQRCEVYYSGHVQGVGFRYTVRHIARRFDVTGFVRNLPDGRVHMIAEGSPDEVARFLKAIADQMAGHVRDAAVDQRPATGEFSTFEIRH